MSIQETQTGEQLSAKVGDLNEYGFDADAKLVLEAQRRYESLRIDMGTVGSPQEIRDLELGFDSIQGVNLRLKVLASDGSGQLLGVADRLTISTGDGDGGHRSLLLFRASSEMGKEIWRLDLEGDEPIVLMNANLPDWNSFARTEEFVALVYPEILKRITIWVLDTEPDPSDDDNPWVAFVRDMCGVSPEDWPEPDDDVGRERVATDVVSKFCYDKDFLAMIWAKEDS